MTDESASDEDLAARVRAAVRRRGAHHGQRWRAGVIRLIEHGELHANVKRWATEQWEGRQLPGNINRLETFIERAELDAWQRSRQPA